MSITTPEEILRQRIGTGRRTGQAILEGADGCITFESPATVETAAVDDHGESIELRGFCPSCGAFNPTRLASAAEVAKIPNDADGFPVIACEDQDGCRVRSESCTPRGQIRRRRHI